MIANRCLPVDHLRGAALLKETQPSLQLAWSVCMLQDTHLAVQVAQFHYITVDYTKSPNASSGQVESRRGAQTARPNHQDSCSAELGLRCRDTMCC